MFIDTCAAHGRDQQRRERRQGDRRRSIEPGKGAKVLWNVADNGRMGAEFLHDEELPERRTFA